jgi:cobalt-zinc-cadmium efflux system membrane fusion protein
VLGALALAVGAAVWARSRSQHKHAAVGAEKVVRDVPYLDGVWIRYSQGFAERNHVEFAAISTSTLSPVVHVTGTVDFDPDKVAAIGARITGRVRNVLKLEGDPVKPGDVLAEIESAELGEAQAALISARAHASAAHVNERRERELAQAKISSERDAEQAAATAASTRADLVAAEGRVRAMGGEPRGEPGILLLHSPIAGRVVNRNLSRGQFVEPTVTAFKVADLSRVFVQLAVFERDVVNIRAGDPVEFSAPGNVKTTVAGRVAYVGDEIDLQTKTATVRVIVEQPTIPLRPGQSVLAKIHTSAAAEPSLVLPREAVTSVDGKPTVFVAHDALSVEPRAIELGRQDGQQVEIAKGLKEGERVVVNGVFALKSEIFR